MRIWFRKVDKTSYRFLLTSRCDDELSESVAFGQKLRYFIDQNGPKRGPHENEF